jgi:hypothetical protein
MSPAMSMGTIGSEEDDQMAVLEVWGPDGRRIVELDGSQLTVGKSAETDLSIEHDGAVSRVHLRLERLGTAWCASDLGSRNGSFVNGERLFGARSLRDGDEIRLGRSRLVFRDHGGSAEPTTDRLTAPPEITRRERDVLIELCRPVLAGNVFTPPASVQEIAAALYITPAAVKQHLGRLYEKFDLFETETTPRRVSLANAALNSGAVTIGDLRPPP